MNLNRSMQRLAFVAASAWTSWTLVARGEDLVGQKHLSADPAPVVETSGSHANNRAPTAPESLPPDFSGDGSAAGKVEIVETEVRQRIRAGMNPATNEFSPEGRGLLLRCVQILRTSRIDSDRFRAIQILSAEPHWPNVPGAYEAVRSVALGDFAAPMRATAIRMLATSGLPDRAVLPTLRIVERFDGSPELREACRGILTASEISRLAILSSNRGSAVP